MPQTPQEGRLRGSKLFLRNPTFKNASRALNRASLPLGRGLKIPSTRSSSKRCIFLKNVKKFSIVPQLDTYLKRKAFFWRRGAVTSNRVQCHRHPGSSNHYFFSLTSRGFLKSVKPWERGIYPCPVAPLFVGRTTLYILSSNVENFDDVIFCFR